MPEHSAEFLRGAKWMAHVLGDSGEEERVGVLLAQAEVCEAGAKSRGQFCTCQSHQFVQCRGLESLGKGWVCRRQQEQDGKAREAREPDAAAVIAQCKEALEELGPYIDAEDCRLAGSGDEDVKDTVIAHAQLLRNALAAIAAWEAGR